MIITAVRKQRPPFSALDPTGEQWLIPDGKGTCCDSLFLTPRFPAITPGVKLKVNFSVLSLKFYLANLYFIHTHNAF